MIVKKTILVSAYLCVNLFAYTPIFQIMTKPFPQAITQTITAADNNKTIPTRVGRTLVIKLNENASTGSEWYVQQLNDKAFKIISDENISDPANKGLVGAPTTRTISLKAIAKGKYTIQLKNYRKWEGPATAGQSFQITVLTK